MLGKAIIVKQFEYNTWANDKILACALDVLDEQLDQPSGYSCGSLRQTLYHIFVVEAMWRQICQFADRPPHMPPITDFPTIAALQQYQQAEDEKLHAFVRGLDEEQLLGTIARQHPRTGQTHELVRWHVLSHMIHHSAQHRSEAAWLLTTYGRSPGDIDFIFFAR
jgi:uncharacterized damage-inducible protein DinB